MLSIALDAMGGDHAPDEIVKGAVEASARYGIEVVLVGDPEAIERHLPRSRPRPSVVPASQTIGFEESPAKAVLNKPDSSIMVGLRLVKEGKAAAFVSAGSTGAVVCAALFLLGTIEGIERPALCLIYSTPSGPSLLLDIGANADCRPEFLLQFAYLGSLYMKNVLGIPNPTVGILSNGEEAGKGNRLVRESYKLLKSSPLNFLGNVEGKDLFRGTARVVVTDGFTGNVVLKANEGFGEALFEQFAGQLKDGLKYRWAAFLLAPLLRAFKRRVDYSEYGGAPLLGVRGNVVVAHGRSRAPAIGNALRLACRMVEQGLPQALEGGGLNVSAGIGR